MTELLFDKLAYMDGLKSTGIAEDHARALADAMDIALRESVATKSDVAAVKQDISDAKHGLEQDIAGLKQGLEQEIAGVKHSLDLAVRDMTIRIGMIGIALFAALSSSKFFG